MNPAFLGTWNVDKSRSSGKEEFADAMGVPKEQFAVLDKLDISVTISQEGSAVKFEIDLHGAAPNHSFSATPGVSCKVPQVDGTSSDMVLTVDGDKLVESYTDEKRGAFTVTRTLSGCEQVVESVKGSAKMTQYLVKA